MFPIHFLIAPIRSEQLDPGVIVPNNHRFLDMFSGIIPHNSKSRQRLLSLRTQMPSTIGNTEYYHGSRLILRFTKSVAILGYLTLQSQGASADQSHNAIIFPCNMNIIKSCLFLLGIHHRHLHTLHHFHRPGTGFKSGRRLPVSH